MKVSITEDFVFRGVIYAADRNESTGQPIATEVEVPEDFKGGRRVDVAPALRRETPAPSPNTGAGETSTQLLGNAPGDEDDTSDSGSAGADVYESKDKAVLLDLVQSRGLNVTGSGTGGGLLKRDLVAALVADDAAKAAPASSSSGEGEE